MIIPVETFPDGRIGVEVALISVALLEKLGEGERAGQLILGQLAGINSRGVVMDMLEVGKCTFGGSMRFTFD